MTLRTEIPSASASRKVRNTAVESMLWRLELARGERHPARMLEALDLPSRELSHGQTPGVGAASFPFRVPRGYVARMERGNPNDPLLKQVLPTAEEDEEAPGYTRDPLNERGALCAPRLLWKYRGRALLIATAACAIHCRYCFRRHLFRGDDGLFERAPETRHLDRALARIGREGTIREVILSGGDPLCLVDEKLAALAEKIAAIPHVTRLRIHTRLPVVLPERVDGALLAWLSGTRLGTVVVIHANHPNEIDGKVEKALLRFREKGIVLLNQSVLLRGVNDNAHTLAALGERLFAAGALPYYLHLLDPVAGGQRFAVGEPEARAIMAGVRAELPGYLVPRLVREVAGAEYKIPL